jgi:hypothetical protein
MKTLLIYDDLVALNREQHRLLKLAPPARPFAFARGTNSVPLASSELSAAVLDFPCVFVEGPEGHSVVALVGLRDHENLFVQPDGGWVRGAYLPAFFRDGGRRQLHGLPGPRLPRAEHRARRGAVRCRGQGDAMVRRDQALPAELPPGDGDQP